MKRFIFAAACLVAGALFQLPAHAQKKYDKGATDAEIMIGNTAPYSGPASALGVITKVTQVYFAKVNSEGGINGRKINFISLDDAYNPSKTVELVRRMVEQDGVLFITGNIGTPTNSAVVKYLNGRKVPHALALTGGSKFNDAESYPWTVPFPPSLEGEGGIFGRHILATQPNAKIAVLYQNDDFGKDVYAGLKHALGDKKSLIVAEASYEVSDPTISSQLVALKNSGANVFVDITSPKFTALAIRGTAELNWKPAHYVMDFSTSVRTVLAPAGLDKAIGLLSAAFLKDASDPAMAKDPGMLEYLEFMRKQMPDADVNDPMNAYGYSYSVLLAKLLKQCGDDLTRDNVIKQATNLKIDSLPTVISGIELETSPKDRVVVKSLQIIRFNGQRWESTGTILRNR